MKIEWSEIAFNDLEGIYDYIAQDTPFYANQFIDKLMSATDKLADFPEIGRQVPEVEDNTSIRELIFHSYRIIYQINPSKKTVLIVTVVHGSRNISIQDPKPWEIV